MVDKKVEVKVYLTKEQNAALIKCSDDHGRSKRKQAEHAVTDMLKRKEYLT